MTAKKKTGKKPTRHRRGPVTPETRLTPKEARFAREYVVHCNGAEAARKAGYAPGSAKVTASVLLTKPNVARAVDEAKAAWLARTDTDGDAARRDIVNAANLDWHELFDARHNLINVRDLPPHVRRCITSMKVVKRNITAGDGKVDQVLELKVIDKGRMHEILARVTGIDKGESATVPYDGPAFVFTDDTKGVSVQ